MVYCAYICPSCPGAFLGRCLSPVHQCLHPFTARTPCPLRYRVVAGRRVHRIASLLRLADRKAILQTARIYSNAYGKIPGWRSAVVLYCKFNRCAVYIGFSGYTTYRNSIAGHSGCVRKFYGNFRKTD